MKKKERAAKDAELIDYHRGIREELLPELLLSAEQRNTLFMQEVQIADSLLNGGEASAEEIGGHFYKAYKLNPTGQDMLPLFKTALPPPVMDMVEKFVQMDTQVGLD